MDIQKVKAKRYTGAVAYSRYCQEKRKLKNCIFCFFEGEDAKYYCPRIERYCGYSYDKIIIYNCGGREGVFKAYNAIEKDGDDESIKRVFFIDSDYDTTMYSNSYLYQTPCYSIENFYASEDAFKKIISREFGINSIDADFIKVCQEYRERLEEFHQKTMYLNAWLACQRFYEGKNEERKVKLSNFKLSKYMSISIDKVECLVDINETELKKKFPDSVEVKQEEIEDKIKYFERMGCTKFFRGKFEIYFLRKIIDSLITKNREGGYFSEKYTSVDINPNINTLSVLNEYADTPSDLIEFLGNYRTA